jgi:hypothetical protein
VWAFAGQADVWKKSSRSRKDVCQPFRGLEKPVAISFQPAQELTGLGARRWALGWTWGTDGALNPESTSGKREAAIFYNVRELIVVCCQPSACPCRADG